MQFKENTHLLISQGSISELHKLLPSMWVDSVSEDAVRISVDEQFVESLHEYALGSWVGPAYGSRHTKL